ncbi:MAG: diacylglycerol kinase [Verrucomicrobia bacterium]|nr:diacylglycerol kinase [Verrucomicrobiota bacterium]
MKTCFVFNPCSGKNRRRPWLVPAIRSFIAAHQLDAELVSTEAPGHATLLARAAISRGCERIVAVGGDGTMNEVAQAVTGTAAALALVPCGSGNGLALHLGIPTSPRAALMLLAGPGHRDVTIDTGVANGHPFFNVMGLGFDAEISRSFNRLVRRGLLAYAVTGSRALMKHRMERCVVHGIRRKCFEMSLIAVANSDQYGNRAYIAPGATVDDGVFDLIVVHSVGLLSALPLAVRLFLGTIDRSRRVTRMRGDRFLIERAGPGLIHTDGETHETSASIEVVVRPRSLRITVPSGCRVPAREPENLAEAAADVGGLRGLPPVGAEALRFSRP